ncbi:uncharacterized protein METZ01_LOCUS129051 [marine metagenome]|uniref:Uncharacterized protein n=1 Tax=marine metagenome TaxID=408172 RepID=A0A381YIE7_9ZZZZ
MFGFGYVNGFEDRTKLLALWMW